MNVPNRRGHESPLFEPLNVTTTTSAVAGRADDTALAFVDCSLVANQPPAAAAAGGVEGWMTLELQFTVGPIRVQAELICFDPGRLKGTWFQPLTLTWFAFKWVNLCRYSTAQLNSHLGFWFLPSGGIPPLRSPSGGLQRGALPRWGPPRLGDRVKFPRSLAAGGGRPRCKR
jgi:hypothetical protein